MFEESSQCRYGLVSRVILIYWCTSILIVFLNKQILSGRFGDEDLTVFSAWSQSMAALGMITCLGFGVDRCISPLKMPKVEYKQLYSKTMILLSLSSVCGMTFNNLMLKHIGVSFYLIARSCTIIFTIGLSVVYLKHNLTWKAVVACFLILCGFVLGIDQEDVLGTLSIFGVLYGLLASFCVAVAGILVKKAELLLDNDSLKLVYYNNLNCSLIFLPLVIGSGQLSSVMESELKFQFMFWLMLIVTGCLSLAVGWASALQVKYTSPITHHLSVNVKSFVQTILAVLFYQESKTGMWWLGSFFIVGGVVFYTLTQVFEDSQTKQNISHELPVVSVRPVVNGHTR